MKYIHKIILAVLVGVAIIGLVAAFELQTVYNPFTGNLDYIVIELDPVFIAWNNFTGIPHATPSDGDVTHFSWADEIYDWVIGLGYLANIVSDTTPQLGGYLDANGQNIGATDDEIENIYIGLNTRIYFGDGQETSIYYNGTNLVLS